MLTYDYGCGKSLLFIQMFLFFYILDAIVILYLFKFLPQENILNLVRTPWYLLIDSKCTILNNSILYIYYI